MNTTVISKAEIKENRGVYTTNEVSNPASKPVIPTTPQTGDSSNMWMRFAMMFINNCGLIGTVPYGKKKKRPV